MELLHTLLTMPGHEIVTLLRIHDNGIFCRR